MDDSLPVPRSLKSGPINLNLKDMSPITEFYCYLKTKKGKFKRHHMAISAKSVQFFRGNT